MLLVGFSQCGPAMAEEEDGALPTIQVNITGVPETLRWEENTAVPPEAKTYFLMMMRQLAQLEPTTPTRLRPIIRLYPRFNPSPVWVTQPLPSTNPLGIFQPITFTTEEWWQDSPKDRTTTRIGWRLFRFP
jgi:hypothetical protein